MNRKVEAYIKAIFSSNPEVIGNVIDFMMTMYTFYR